MPTGKDPTSPGLAPTSPPYALARAGDPGSKPYLSGTTTIKDYLDEQKRLWSGKARSIDFAKVAAGGGKDVKAQLYREAKRIDLNYHKERMQHNWLRVYYLLHLYMELCLRYNLHKPDPKAPKFNEEATAVFKNLDAMEARMETADRGMLWQLENLREQELRLVAQRADKQMWEERQRSLEALAAMDALRLDAPPPPAAPRAPPEAAAAAPPPASSSSYGMSRTTDMTPESVTNLELKTVTGDGHCAFRAIAQGKANGKLSIHAETAEALRLRRLAVELLMEKADHDMTGSGLTVRQVVLMTEDHASFQAYLDAMGKSHFAGETELWLLAGALKTPISVFRENEAKELEHMITYGEQQNAPAGTGICLLWQRGKHSERGNHYDVMLRAE